MLLWCVLCQKALPPRSSRLLPICLGGRNHFLLNSWASLVLRLQFTKYQQRYAPTKYFLFLFFILFICLFFLYIYLFYFFFFFFFFFEFHLQFISGAMNYTGASFCATSYYLPQAYNAPLGGALVHACGAYKKKIYQFLLLPWMAC